MQQIDRLVMVGLDALPISPAPLFLLVAIKREREGNLDENLG